MQTIRCRPIAEGETPAVTLTDKDGTAYAVMCAWFIGCPRDATGTTEHPALGDVPTCDRCANYAHTTLQED